MLESSLPLLMQVRGLERLREGLAQDGPAGWTQSPIAAGLQPVPIFLSASLLPLKTFCKSSL